MVRFLLLIFALSFLNHPALPCITGKTKELQIGGTIFKSIDGEIPYGYHIADKKILEEYVRKMDTLYAYTKDLDYLSDKGLLLILLKRNNEAIKLFLDIENKKPNQYATAANLGTAYELKGQYNQAHRWTKRAIELDPAAHFHSEWIHLRMLRARMKGSTYYTSQFILTTDFGKEPVPSSSLSKQALEHLSQALYYQLNERVTFIKPKDALIAQLMFDLGNVSYLLGNYEKALKDYKLAKEYGFHHTLIEDRIKETNGKLKKSNELLAGFHPKFIGLICFILAMLLIWIAWVTLNTRAK